MSTLIIGMLLVLNGAGGFALTRSVMSGIPALAGVALILLGLRLIKVAESRIFMGIALSISAITMVFTASAVPRFVRLLTGAEVERSGDILVVGTTALLCLLHVTLLLRTLLRSRSSS
ncbi:MAG: hypothetical protein NTX15_11245 [Candidatus Kapabacteria bacterium]|nr:hypothetical protein [Candidatus Kapabacteria bacterium]